MYNRTDVRMHVYVCVYIFKQKEKQWEKIFCKTKTSKAKIDGKDV